MTSGAVQVTTAREMIASIEEQMRIYAALILGIGAVSLVVGGVGIMNVMLMSVMERRQEIGLRLAVGARCRDIRLMFLSETLILSAIGSATGTSVGYLAGWIFAGSSGWQFEAALLALPLGAGMALIVGLFFGIYPAARAARLEPVAALRSE
jgi:putative ABC transport system permease protein